MQFNVYYNNSSLCLSRADTRLSLFSTGGEIPWEWEFGLLMGMEMGKTSWEWEWHICKNKSGFA